MTPLTVIFLCRVEGEFYKVMSLERLVSVLLLCPVVHEIDIKTDISNRKVVISVVDRVLSLVMQITQDDLS